MDHCSNCGIEANDNELYEVINHDADEIQYVCSRCLEFYTRCDQCGMFRPDDLVTYKPETRLYTCNLCNDKAEESVIPVLDMDLEEESWRD
jgi:uncharacterized Zn finger protein